MQKKQKGKKLQPNAGKEHKNYDSKSDEDLGIDVMNEGPVRL